MFYFQTKLLYFEYKHLSFYLPYFFKHPRRHYVYFLRRRLLGYPSGRGANSPEGPPIYQGRKILPSRRDSPRQKKRYQSLPSLPGEMGTYREVLREFYTVVCYCFGDLYGAQKQWAKAVQYYQEGLELFKQCELVEGFDNGSEDLKVSFYHLNGIGD